VIGGRGALRLGTGGVEVRGDRGDAVAVGQPETVIDVLRDAQFVAAVAKQRSLEPDTFYPGSVFEQAKQRRQGGTRRLRACSSVRPVSAPAR